MAINKAICKMKCPCLAESNISDKCRITDIASSIYNNAQDGFFDEDCRNHQDKCDQVEKENYISPFTNREEHHLTYWTRNVMKMKKIII